jgi:hypothetical protein
VWLYCGPGAGEGRVRNGAEACPEVVSPGNGVLLCLIVLPALAKGSPSFFFLVVIFDCMKPGLPSDFIIQLCRLLSALRL